VISGFKSAQRFIGGLCITRFEWQLTPTDGSSVTLLTLLEFSLGSALHQVRMHNVLA
jgi:hypothetical protein